jgi:hypothetical protein
MHKTIAVAYFLHTGARAASRQHDRNLSTAILTASRRVDTAVRDALTQRMTPWQRLNAA